MNSFSTTVLDIPDFSLVVLIGATGAGKSTFASKWFLPSEIISSDQCRAMVSDDPNDQSVTGDAFELVKAIAEKRLKHRRLTVIDATNVRASERRAWVEIARRWHALPVAVVLDPGLDVCIERNKERPDRKFGAAVPQRMVHEIHRGFRGLAKEGFRQVWRLSSVDDINGTLIERKPLWTDKREDDGPFDIIGDVHGCAEELETLLTNLGYRVEWTAGEPLLSSPHGRKLVFAGDLVDRGPRTPDTLRIAMAAVAAGIAYAVAGNHDQKLARWLAGRNVKIAHGLQESIDQLQVEPEAFRAKVRMFLDDLRSHFWLDGGKLAVAHAGLKEEMIGRGSPAVRSFAMFGDTTGETDEFGLPVRNNWSAAYRGATAIAYGHTPMVEAEWVNNTICIDTGCVFGGKLTALRWPEKELVSVPAKTVWATPARPLTMPMNDAPSQVEADALLDYSDVSGRRWIETSMMGRIVVAEENAVAALEAMSRFAIAPQWLVYLPPTMSPVETSKCEGFLERPEEAFAFFQGRGQRELVLEEKHMGSRAIIALCRDDAVARRRFGTTGLEAGAIWTRTGRSFFADAATTGALLDRLRKAADSAGLWETLATDWLLLDAEIMPWSAKASSLIAAQYEPVAVSGKAGLTSALAAAEKAARRGVPTETLCDRLASRAEKVASYAIAWVPYVWPVSTLDDIRIAPFHLLASEGAVHFDRDHLWHMEIARSLVETGVPSIVPTAMLTVSLDDESKLAEATNWWEQLVAEGSEGMVVKPRAFVPRGSKGLIQPALKVRGPEYLRIIYGPEYDLPENLSRLRERSLGAKRSAALREFALGHEALTRFVGHAPLRRTHECVFAILALESDPIDPRL